MFGKKYKDELRLILEFCEDRTDFTAIVVRSMCREVLYSETVPIVAGDWVTTNGKYPGLAKYFKDGPLKVLEVTPNKLKYTGGAFVLTTNQESAFYASGLKKVR